jgi:hypothetical protein
MDDEYVAAWKWNHFVSGWREVLVYSYWRYYLQWTWQRGSIAVNSNSDSTVNGSSCLSSPSYVGSGTTVCLSTGQPTAFLIRLSVSRYHATRRGPKIIETTNDDDDGRRETRGGR